MFGWRGRLLRVNLTSGLVRTEALEQVELRDYLGGRGLGVYLHARDVSVSTPPLSPGNHLIFTTGPLTGTLAPNGGRFTVVTRTPPAGALVAASISGKWGPALKCAGFDAIVVEGRAAEPVDLLASDGKAEIRAAASMRGKPVTETTELLLKETDPRAVAACIGPAGENAVGCAVIVSDGFSAAGRGGAGAVMGSKNLKAVVVSGTGGFRMADQHRFLKSALELRSFMKARSIDLKGARAHDPVLEADSLEWNDVKQDSGAARTRGCFGCATSFSSFLSDDGRSLPLLAGSPPAELNECLREYRYFLDLGLDYSVAKGLLASLGEKSQRDNEELVQKLAAGQLPQQGGHGVNVPSMDRGPCIAAGYAIFPRIQAADGLDQAASDLMAILDSAGLCPFLCSGIGMDTISELLTSATGIEFSQPAVVNVAERISRSLRWID